MSVYTQVYRGDLEGISKTSVKVTLDKLDMLMRGYKEGGLCLDVIVRQMCITPVEAEYFVKNTVKEMERIKGYISYCDKDKDISDEQILKHMGDMEDKIVIRMLDGETMGSICEDLGILYRRSAVGKFKRKLLNKGYAINKIQQHYRILFDISRGLSVDEIIRKYKKQFVNERDLNNYVRLHQYLYGEKEDKYETA